MSLLSKELWMGARACILDCAEVKAGENVLILCESSLRVEDLAVQALASVVEQAGAEVEVLWTAPLLKSWWEDVPRIVVAAFEAADVVIHCHYTIGRPHKPIHHAIFDKGVRFIRNYATTVRTLSSDWARWPMDLYNVIEMEIVRRLTSANSFRVTTPSGSDISGDMDIAQRIRSYFSSDKPMGKQIHRVFPPGVYVPIRVKNTNGIYMVENVISWGARIWGLPEVMFEEPVKLTVERGRVTNIEGGREAPLMRRAFEYIATKALVGEETYDVNSFHCGTHPKASLPVPPQVDPDLFWHLYHHHSGFFHFHIGGDTEKDYGTPYMTHISCMSSNATLYLDGEKLYDEGRLTLWDNLEIRKIAEQYGNPDELFSVKPLWF